MVDNDKKEGKELTLLENGLIVPTWENYKILKSLKIDWKK